MRRNEGAHNLTTHITEATTTVCGVLDEEATGVVLITGLRADDRGSADNTSLCLLKSISVGGIEAARETAHHPEMRLSLGGLDNFFALPRKSVSCWFRQYAWLY